tara:strand:+ start:781 stop:1080 length:300 start_codon:yes stop_codon:yes gene_type:complete
MNKQNIRTKLLAATANVTHVDNWLATLPENYDRDLIDATRSYITYYEAQPSAFTTARPTCTAHHGPIKTHAFKNEAGDLVCAHCKIAEMTHIINELKNQ